MKRFALICLGLVAFGGLVSTNWGHAQPAAVSTAETDSMALPAGVPTKVAVVLSTIDETGAAPQGFVGGRVFTNDGRGGEQVLPRIDKNGEPITYHEYDVNKHVRGVNRGTQRLVLGTDGSAYYTGNHYQTFITIRGGAATDVATESARTLTVATRALAPVMALPADVSAKVNAVLDYVLSHGQAMPNYVGGRVFENRGGAGAQRLPLADADGDAIEYHEWDVNPRVPGRNRGTQRLITGSDGSAYYTGDHYRTFTRFK